MSTVSDKKGERRASPPPLRAELVEALAKLLLADLARHPVQTDIGGGLEPTA